MADDEHALAAVLTRDHFHRAPQPENHVAPALAPGRTMIEFSKKTPEFCLLRMALADADASKAIEYSEFLLAQPLVNHERVTVPRQSSALDDEIGGVPRAQIRRRENHVRPLVGSQRGEPGAERARL